MTLSYKPSISLHVQMQRAWLAVLIRILTWLVIKVPLFMNCMQLQGFTIDSHTFAWVGRMIKILLTLWTQTPYSCHTLTVHRAFWPVLYKGHYCCHSNVGPWPPGSSCSTRWPLSSMVGHALYCTESKQRRCWKERFGWEDEYVMELRLWPNCGSPR